MAHQTNPVHIDSLSLSNGAQTIAFCDRCSKPIHDIRHKCQQCPDFDYCSTCIIQAAQIHPHHQFMAMDGGGALSGDLQRYWDSQKLPGSQSDSTLRLIGQSCQMPQQMCQSCTPLTMPLPALNFLLQDEEIKAKAGRQVAFRWPLRISGLVEATQKGCAFCTFMLNKFFGPSDAHFWGYEPVRPWYMETDQNDRRDKLVKHAMEMLTRLKTDKFVFTVDPLCSNDGFAIPNFDKLQISFMESDHDEKTLMTVFATRGKIYVTLQVFAATGNPAADFVNSRPPNATPSSNKGLGQAATWIRECEANHGYSCQNRQPHGGTSRPKRLIDVSNEGRLKLHESLPDDDEPYITLSYCWGGPQQFYLTKATYKAKLDGFHLSDLPPSLRDAVKVTQALEIKYLWVDSVCIIQDDEGDMRSEIANMTNIYRNTYLTICAANAKSVNDGFLRDIADSETGLWRNLIPLGFPVVNDQAKSISDAFQQPRSVFGTIWLMDEAPDKANTFRDPTSRRGWCLQELLLSPRILNYGRWPTWRCGRSTLSDGGWYTEDERLGPKERCFALNIAQSRTKVPTMTRDLFTTYQMLQNWYSIVNEYTKRELSIEADKLPAIGGIAAEIQRTTGVQYRAGLWQDNLLHDLMWYTQAREWLARPKEWRAPSWSWASVNSPVRYGGITEDAMPMAQVIECQVLPEGFNYIQRGKVVIEGPIRIVSRDDVIQLFNAQNLAPSPPRSNDVQEWDRLIMEFISNSYNASPSDEEVVLESLPKQVFAIVTHSRGWYMEQEEKVSKVCYSGLLLKEVEGGYERIGYFMNEDRPWLAQIGSEWRTEIITIV